ncbi:MAG TPA: hypothetical protein DCP71_06350 [Verrucomicrobiales bacterium]|nr:hypothetical protein [Verrucomicrobiales bacterium]
MVAGAASAGELGAGVAHYENSHGHWIVWGSHFDASGFSKSLAEIKKVAACSGNCWPVAGLHSLGDGAVDPDGWPVMG